MVQDDQPRPNEAVIRIIIRHPAELFGIDKRELLDAMDFVRRKIHPKTKQPEDGISLLRKSAFATSNQMYSYIGSKKAMGIAECQLEDLTNKGFYYVITGNKGEHISLRCSVCNKADL